MEKEDQRIPQTSEEFSIAASWERVKYELLNRYYELLTMFREYQYYVLSKKDHIEHRKQITTALASIWLQLRDFQKTFKDIKDFDKWDEFMQTVVNEKAILNYEGIAGCMKVLCSMAKAGGLTNIEFEKRQTDKAILEF